MDIGIELPVDLASVFYFQDKLSKFCPADKDRPNGFEKEMFRLGALYAIYKISILLDQKDQMELIKIKESGFLSWLEENKTNILGEV